MHYFNSRGRERQKKVEQKQFHKKHSLVLKRNISNIWGKNTYCLSKKLHFKIGQFHL